MIENEAEIENGEENEEAEEEIGEAEEEIDEAEEEIGEETGVFEKPKFVLVEFSQYEKLFQRCARCGSLPKARNAGKPRPITWTASGKIFRFFVF